MPGLCDHIGFESPVFARAGCFRAAAGTFSLHACLIRYRRETVPMKRDTALDRSQEKDAQDDLELVEQFRAGDSRAFDMLIAKYENRIFNFTYRMLGDYQNAREVTQDIFLRAFRYMGNFRGEGKFSTWLYTIASSTGKNAIAYYNIREKYKQQLHADPEHDNPRDPIENLPDDTGSPERALERKTENEFLARALGELPEDFRHILVLKDINELPYEDIGKILDIPMGTVKSRIARGRAMLRDRLAAMGCLEKAG